MKILIADAMSNKAEDIFSSFSSSSHPLQVLRKEGLSESELIQEIVHYDALVVRSSTKVTKAIIEAGSKLKVIGRAGIGIDNIDVKAATSQGVVVMNAPFGNSITTAEHALSLLLSTARHIPYANTTTHKGHWEKNTIKGVEIQGKTLGIIGCGNIGKIVAKKAIGFGMKVIAYDPFLAEENAQRLDIQLLDFETVMSHADFITCHLPLNEKTRHIINNESLALTKKGVRIINCSRGGIVDEKALLSHLQNNHVAGAALDVFEQEPLPKDSPLFHTKNLILTPHLGGSTVEAQEKVVEEIAKQISNYLINGAIKNAVNTISLSAQQNKEIAPYQQLAKHLSAFLGQIITQGISKIIIEYYGDILRLPTSILSQTIIYGIVSPNISEIHAMNAITKAQERGIHIESHNIEESQEYHSLINIRVYTESSCYSIAGTLFTVLPRIVKVRDIAIEAHLGKHNLYVINKDAPGFITTITQILAKNNINIASFHLGRKNKGEEAASIIVCDEEISSELLEEIQQLPLVSFCRCIYL